MKKISLLIIVLSILFTACSTGNSGETTTSEDIRDNFNVTDAQGDMIDLTNEKDYLFVNFWATWCKPCITEMPSIQALQDSLSDAPIRFILVTNETPAETGDFLQQRSIDLEGFHMTDAAEAFNLGGFPTTLIIDPEGKIILRSEGAEEWNSPERIYDIRRLLSE
jgi:thiol-disulfide isomerase/thioredoxin